MKPTDKDGSLRFNPSGLKVSHLKHMKKETAKVSFTLIVNFLHSSQSHLYTNGRSLFYNGLTSRYHLVDGRRR